MTTSPGSRVIAVAGTSHSPMVTLPPDVIWSARAVADRSSIRLIDTDGQHRTYDELAARNAGCLDAELTPEVWKRKHGLALASIERLGADLLALEPDLVLVVGDDQKEMYDFDNFPALALHYDERLTMEHPPRREAAMSAETETEVRKLQGLDGSTHPGDADAGRRLIAGLIKREFDVSAGRQAREGTAFGHAVAFVLVRLLKSSGIPCVPVLLNTYFAPNQPTPKRCVDLGVAVAEAVRELPGSRRVAVVASGGLSHFVVDPELDEALLNGMREGDLDALRALPAERMDSGTSEGRNWLVAAGAGAAEGLTHAWSEYVPAYRSPAGTGVGLAFGLWT